ncbi:MAG: hypothetical protein WKF71_05185 [Pyrinomonadaceae bacterium]
MEVWTVRQAELPIVSMNLVLKSGGTLDPTEKSGLASMTAALLDDGTKTRSAARNCQRTAVNRRIFRRGFGLGFGKRFDADADEKS